MSTQWLAIQSFQRSQDLLAAINTREILYQSNMDLLREIERLRESGDPLSSRRIDEVLYGRKP